MSIFTRTHIYVRTSRDVVSRYVLARSTYPEVHTVWYIHATYSIQIQYCTNVGMYKEEENNDVSNYKKTFFQEQIKTYHVRKVETRR